MKKVAGLGPRFGCVLAALLAAGCVTGSPPVDAEKTIEEALALGDAVAFRTQGDPLDAVLPAVDALSLEMAVRRAVETSPELQGALARVRVAQAEAELARLLPNPVLDLVFRFPEGGGSPTIEAGLATDLLVLLQRPRRASAATRRLEAEAASALSTALDVVAETQELYADAQALDRLVPLLEERLGTLDRLREVARTRLDLGEGTRQDAISLDAERLELEIELAGSRQQLRIARLALARRIGTPSGPEGWRLDPWRPAPVVETAEPGWIVAALRSRPELLALEWEIGARMDEAALARWSLFEGASAGVDAERDGDWSLGPGTSLPLPVFDGGGARERRALAVEVEARHRLTEVQRGIVEEVRASFLALAGSQENLARVVQELVPLQERRLEAIEEAYRLGHVDVTALLVAEQAVQVSRTRRVELERDVFKALLHLQRAVGGPQAFSTAALAEQPMTEQ